MIDKPRKFVFQLRNPPKAMNCNAIIGFISQNFDGDPPYLKTAMIYPNADPFNMTAPSTEQTNTYEFLLDPKIWELGSSLIETQSLDFFYFIMQTDHPSFCFEFGETYMFDAWFEY